jgi:hypothetical protein
MTTTNDRVLAAIADGETTVQGICETTGLEANQVHQAAFLLKKSGSIIKGEAGYELTDAALEPPAAEDSSPPPVAKRKYKKRTPKSARAPKAASTKKRRYVRKAQAPRQSNGHVASNGHASVEFARFGDFVVLKRPDVVELLQLMRRWSDMVEGMLK